MRLASATAAISLAFAADLKPSTNKDEVFIGQRRNYWAFREPEAAPPPALNSVWVRSPIDAFILEALTAKKLTPSPAVSPDQLVRRLYLDATGLPPTPEDLDRFLADRAASGDEAAWAKLVDRLLATPQYGERLALKWLDVVRYADTNGFELDQERPDAWRYRDYVIRSFNEDKPYNRFLEEQLAGDELFPKDADALIALGFLRAGPRHVVGGNQDLEMNRQEELVEMTSAVSTTFVGLTLGCARCHNHKFDPILQSDYYRLQAIFAGTDFKDVDIATPAENRAYKAALAAWDARLKPITDRIAAIEKPYRDRLREEKIAQLDAPLAAAVRVPKSQRTPEQQKLAKDAEGQLSLTWDLVVNALSPDDRARRAALRHQMHNLELERPREPAKAFTVENVAKDPPVTHILKVGDYHMKLDPVGPGFPKVLSASAAVPDTAAGRRAALAKWLASPDNPLTARVMVNRLWQFRMGVGIVPTPNDFGLLGGNPTNRKLLDWLAVEFTSHDWSVKHIDRLIFLSSAYRQSSADDAAKTAIDPENKLNWRMNRRRLEAETLRDTILATSGLLNAKMGGPPVRVPIEPEVYGLIFTEGEPDNLWPLSPDKSEQYRRSIYLLNKRTVRLPMLANFDQPDEMTSCPVRPSSTHALQALSLMNSDFMEEQSRAFALRLEGGCGADRGCAVKLAYRLALGRAPSAKESELARQFFRKDSLLPDFCLALLNRNEFVYIP